MLLIIYADKWEIIYRRQQMEKSNSAPTVSLGCNNRSMCGTTACSFKTLPSPPVRMVGPHVHWWFRRNPTHCPGPLRKTNSSACSSRFPDFSNQCLYFSSRFPYFYPRRCPGCRWEQTGWNLHSLMTAVVVVPRPMLYDPLRSHERPKKTLLILV